MIAKWLRKIGFVIALVGLLTVFAGCRSIRIHTNPADEFAALAEQEGNLIAARALLQEAAKLRPSYSTYYWLSQSYILEDDLDGAISIWDQAIAAYPREGWPYYGLGERYEQLGEWEKSQGLFSLAVQYEPQNQQYVEAFARPSRKVQIKDLIFSELESILKSSETDITYFLDEREPDWRRSLNISEGNIQVVAQMVDSDWEFLGYFNQNPKAPDESFLLFLFWEGKTDQMPGDSRRGWFHLENEYWVQIISDAANLVVNGNFDQDSPGEKIPSAFSKMAAEDQSGVFRLVTRSDIVDWGNILVMDHDGQEKSSRLVSDVIPVETDALYLQTGMVRSINGRAYLGRNWLGGSAGQSDRYLVENETSGIWQFFAEVVSPPVGSVGTQVLAMNYSGSGAVLFDHLSFIKIGKPNDMQFQLRHRLNVYLETEAADDRLIQDQSQLLEEDVYILNQELTTGWTLLGYIGHLDRIAQGAVEPLALFWLGPDETISAGQPEEGWIDLGEGYWVRLIETAGNLLPDGGFEAGLADGRPVGFPYDLYETDGSPISLAERDVAGTPSMALALSNSETYTQTGLFSVDIPVDSEEIYLQSGRAQGNESGLYLGCKWSGNLPPETNSLVYLASNVQPSQWQSYVGAAEPPPGAFSSNIRLLNLNNTGTAYFDNLAFIPIGKPNNLRFQLNQRLLDYLDEAQTSDDAAIITPLALQPIQLVHQTLENGWQFRGYWGDEAVLARGESAPLLVLWQSPDPAEKAGLPEDGWRDLGDGYWLQIVPAAASLLINGNFESGLEGDRPVGFPADIYNTDPSARQLIEVERAGHTTMSAALVNTETMTETSYVSIDLPIYPDTVCLQTGWMQSADSNTYLGYRWNGGTPLEGQTRLGYIAAGVRPPSWQHYAGVAIPIPRAKTVEIRLLNRNRPGTAYFDDLVFVSVQIPASNRFVLYQQAMAYLHSNSVPVLSEALENDLLTFSDVVFGEGWTLMAYLVDESRLVAGETVTQFSFWEAPASDLTMPPADRLGVEWADLGNGIWMAAQENVTNMIPVGNFEAPEEDILAFYANDRYDANSASRQIVVSTRGAISTTVGMLDNSGPDDKTSFVSVDIPVDENFLYFQAGWVRSQGGNGFLGRRWVGFDATDDRSYSYAAQAVTDEDWSYYSEFIEPLPGSTSTWIYLLNIGEEGTVMFDDLIFTPFPNPGN